MKANKNQKKTLMWYKIKQLKDAGLNKSQIAEELGINRKTVRRYMAMELETFEQWIQQTKKHPKLLMAYYSFVEKRLKEHPYLSSAQIEDRLKEHYPDFPEVHSKTIYNFVQYVRNHSGIEKPPKERHRAFEKQAAVEYGEEAQVDFGQSTMKEKEGGRKKVWFFTMVLSRSRQKYVYFQDNPFTTETAIYAHKKAFEYFQGVPRKVIYDQDRVFMVDENMGDLLLTIGFEHYARNESFTAVFCRKADPQSKGKVENVVKYVKYNFVRGRFYNGLENLNESVLGWLTRTGNGKVHSTTRLVPHQEWLKERGYLLAIRNKVCTEVNSPSFMPYNIRKDNTIAYKGNYYSVPSGSYKNKESKVLISVLESKMDIFDINKNYLATHTVSKLKGRDVLNTDHHRDKSIGLKERRQEVIRLLGGTHEAVEFIEGIAQSKPRYFNDNLRNLLSSVKNPDKAVLEKSVKFCLTNKMFNAAEFEKILNHYLQEALQPDATLPITPIDYTLPLQAYQIPETSRIITYHQILAL